MILQNIDKINHSNLKTKPFDHIIVENFITGLDNKTMFENYLSTCKDISDQNYPPDGPRYVTNYYNVNELITEKQDLICQAINNVWNVNVDEIRAVNNMISKGQNLTIHNDYYPPEDDMYVPPVRGIVYCNPEYTFGTNIYDHDENNECIPDSIQTVGGQPGTLFLFRVSDKSWHSALNTENKSHRIIVSFRAVNVEEHSAFFNQNT